MSAANDPPATPAVATRPVLRVIRGDATDTEIAALLAVVAARSAAPDRPSRRPGPPPASGWTDRAAQVRRPVQPGPGAWQASARTR